MVDFIEKLKKDYYAACYENTYGNYICKCFDSPEAADKYLLDKVCRDEAYVTTLIPTSFWIPDSINSRILSWKLRPSIRMDNSGPSNKYDDRV